MLFPTNFDSLFAQSKAHEMDPTELAIQSAIRDLETGVHKSQRKAADAHRVARSTLQERLHGRQSHAVAHQSQQRLTPEQEDFLADWILSENAHARPPSRPSVREMATRILRMNGDYEPLGQQWVPHFVARHPQVASIIGRSAVSVKTTAASHDTMHAFLELSACTRVELGVRYEDIRGIDETRVAPGVRTNAHMLAGYGEKKTNVDFAKDREWVSVIETTAVVGRRVQCLVILHGKHLQSTWFPAQGTPDWLYADTENGWTANCIGYEWLRRIFIPGSTPRSDRYRLLFSSATTSSL